MTLRVNMAKAAGIMAGAIGTVIVTLWWGYAASVLWGWFVSPIFHAPALGVANASGLLILSRIARGADHRTRETDKLFFLHLVFRPAIALFFGWIIKGLLP